GEVRVKVTVRVRVRVRVRTKVRVRVRVRVRARVKMRARVRVIRLPTITACLLAGDGASSRNSQLCKNPLGKKNQSRASLTKHRGGCKCHALCSFDSSAK